MSGRISIYEVAKKAKCSAATVSNVLNNKTGKVGLKTRKLVMRVVDELGYQVSSAARSLRKQRLEKLGILYYPSCTQIFRHPFYGEIMEGVEKALSLTHYHLIFAGYRPEVPDSMLQGKVDGMILLGRFPTEVIENSNQASLPLMLLDSNSEWPIDSVVSDGFGAEIQVVNYLKTQGHKNIVMLGYQMQDYNVDLRIKGFLAGMAMSGLKKGAGNVIREWLSHDDIYAALRERLKGPNPPTAVVAVNDTLAMAMIERLQEDGIRVPDEVSVVGYGDDLENRSFLSTVRVDKRKLGQVATELILKRIEDREMPVTKLRLPTEFIERESVARVCDRELVAS